MEFDCVYAKKRQYSTVKTRVKLSSNPRCYTKIRFYTCYWDWGAMAQTRRTAVAPGTMVVAVRTVVDRRRGSLAKESSGLENLAKGSSSTIVYRQHRTYSQRKCPVFEHDRCTWKLNKSTRKSLTLHQILSSSLPSAEYCQNRGKSWLRELIASIIPSNWRWSDRSIAISSIAGHSR